VERSENVLALGIPEWKNPPALRPCPGPDPPTRPSIVLHPCSLLVQQLLVAKRDLKLPRLLKGLSKYEVILIDDIGYVEQNREEMEVLFILLAERYERGV